MMSRKSKIYLLLFTLGSAVYNIFLPLHPDEAYYWVWSKNLQLSYFDHPPMIAYLIKIITFLGNQEVIIRLLAVLCVSLTAWIIYIMASDMFNKSVAEKSLIIYLLMPLTQAGYIVVSPDSPLILFWVLTIYFFYRYVYKEDNKYVYLAGLAAGLLMLSKYTGILLLAALFVFLLITKKRKLFLQKEVLLSTMLIIILFLPVLVWNYNHDWVSFKFQFSHGVSEDKNLNLNYLGEFIGGQSIAFNPVFFILLFYLILKKYRDIINNKLLFLLFCPFFLTFMFFLYQGAFESSEVNWPAPAYITGTIIVAYYLEKFNFKKIYKVAVITAIILLIVVRFPMFIPGFPKEAVLLNKFAGYDKIFKSAGNYVNEDEVVLSDNYQNASIARYYLPGKPETHIITRARMSNYNYWSEDIKDKISNNRVKKAVYIGQKDAAAELEGIFKRVKMETILTYNGKYINRNYFLYKCSN